MDGIFIGGYRPKSKKEIREAVSTRPQQVRIQSTSMFGGFDGLLSNAPAGRYDFVGPDPYTSRKFYGSITVTGSGTVTVK